MGRAQRLRQARREAKRNQGEEDAALEVHLQKIGATIRDMHDFGKTPVVSFLDNKGNVLLSEVVKPPIQRVTPPETPQLPIFEEPNIMGGKHDSNGTTDYSKDPFSGIQLPSVTRGLLQEILDDTASSRKTNPFTKERILRDSGCTPDLLQTAVVYGIHRHPPLENAAPGSKERR